MIYHVFSLHLEVCAVTNLKCRRLATLYQTHEYVSGGGGNLNQPMIISAIKAAVKF